MSVTIEERIPTKNNKQFLSPNDKESEICHKKWRYILLEIEKELKQLHPNYSVCGPFGFELLSNADSAPKHIRKFYVYANNPQEKSIALISELIEEYTFKNIGLYCPEILNDFVIKIHNQSVDFLCAKNHEFTATDKLLDIQVRNTQSPIVENYANYIILSYQAILGKIGEASHYEDSALYRSRMFQLSLMLFHLYRSFLPKQLIDELAPLSKEFKPFINNSLAAFLESTTHKISMITETEKFLTNVYVIPLCNTIDKVLSDSTQKGEYFQLSAEPYHAEAAKKFEANINKELYNNLLNIVSKTYKNFC